MLVRAIVLVNILQTAISLILKNTRNSLLSRTGRIHFLDHYTKNEIEDVSPSPRKGESLSRGWSNVILKPRVDSENEKLYFLVLVHSKPDNFLERKLIRETWGSVKKYKQWRMQVIFVMGKPGGGYFNDHMQHKDEDFEKNSVLKSRSLHHHDTFFNSKKDTWKNVKLESTMRLLELESNIHRDLLLGDFLDVPGNETEKYNLGFQWALGSPLAKLATFVLKMEDNVFVEIFHLYNFISAVYGPSPVQDLICDVIPAGTFGQRQGHQVNSALNHVPTGMFPKFCSSSAYLITPKLLMKMLKIRDDLSKSVPEEVPDDIMLTGLIREHLRVPPIYLNLRYSHGHRQAERWLNNGQPLTPLPFIFVVRGTHKDDRSWSSLVNSLWEKSVKIQEDFNKMQNIL